MANLPANLPKVKLSFLEKAIAKVNPTWGMNTVKYKMGMQALAGFGVSGYVTPGSSKRSMRGWLTTANSVDRDTIPFLDKARAGSRDLSMNTPVAVAALKKMRTNVIGYGLSLQCQIDRDFLGMSADEAAKWHKKTEREFKVWAESYNCDSRRSCNFYELQAQAFFNVLLSGDVFVMLPYVKRQGVPYDLRVQLIEADYVSNPLGTIDTTTFAGGVETDEWNAPIAYHLRTLPPGLSIFTGTGDFSAFLGTWERIEAFGKKSGRRNVLHLFQADRMGQRRGIPMLTPVMEMLKQLTRFTESELMAAVVTSFFTVFIKNVVGGNSSLADSFVLQDKVANSDPITAGLQTNPSDATTYEMGSGNIIQLDPDEEIQMADPKRPNSAFQGFFEAVVKQIGAAIEMPYEILMGHFNASYSASRGAILEAWKKWKCDRVWVGRNFNQPVYEEWLTEAIIKGRIDAPGFFDDPAIRAAWCNTKWTGPGQGQLDPLKETQAAILRINGHLSTYEDEYVAIHGEDWEASAQRAGREKEVIKQNGLDAPVSIPKIQQLPIDNEKEDPNANT